MLTRSVRRGSGFVQVGFCYITKLFPPKPTSWTLCVCPVSDALVALDVALRARILSNSDRRTDDSGTVDGLPARGAPATCTPTGASRHLQGQRDRRSRRQTGSGDC